jgi:hypothetical protein
MLGGRGPRSRASRALISAAVSGETFAAASGDSINGELLRELIDGVYGRVHRRGIRVRGLTIMGDVDITHAKWSGVLELGDCVVEGDVLLTHAELRGHIDLSGTSVRTLDIRYLDLQGRLTAARLMAKRGIRGLGASITGGLALQDAELTAPVEAESRNLAALDLYRASIGDLFLNRATLYGGLYAIGTTVARNVRLQGAKVWSRAELGLDAGIDAGRGVDLGGVHVLGSIYLCSIDGSHPLELHGAVSLGGSESRNFWVTRDQLRSIPINLNGYIYKRLGPATGEDVLKALASTDPSPDQAYTQLAEFASLSGAAQLRRRVLIAQQRRIARAHPRFSVEGMRRRAFGLFVGYGYAPGLAVYWLLVDLAATVVLLRSGGFAHGADDAHVSPSWSQAFILAVDHLLPFAGLDARSEWVLLPEGVWAWMGFIAFVLLKLAAWILTALAAASATGLVRRV